MTISSEDRSTAPFTGNGVATSFPFTFKVFTASDLVVVLTDADGVDNVLVLDSDYSVTLNPDQDNNPGGTITYPIIGSPLAVGESLIAYGDITYLQPADIVNQFGFYPRVIENALDRVTMLIQQVLGLARRAIRVPVSAANVNTELPDIAQRAGRVVAFDADGNVIVSDKTLLEIESNADIRQGSRTTQVFDEIANGQTVIDTLYNFVPGANQIAVSLNGALLTPPRNGLVIDYEETGPNTITFVQPLSAGDVVVVELYGQTTNFVEAENVGYDGGSMYEAAQGVGLINGIDPTGAADCTAAIQAALTARDVVTLPAGDFKISGSIALKSGNTLRGQGMGATRIFRDTGAVPFDFFEGVTVSDILVEGIFFDSVAKLPVDTASNRHCALRFWDNNTGNRSQRIEIRGCKFSKFTSAEVQAEGNRGVIAVDKCNEVMIHNCRFFDNRSTCIFYFDSKSIQVTDNYCQGEQVPYDLVFQPTQGLGSFVSGGGEGHTVALNRIYETGYSSINVGGTGVQVVGNTIENPSYSGIGVNESHSTAARGVNIVGNSVRGAKLAGIYLWNVADFTVTGNVVEACGITNTSGGIRIQDASGGAPTNGVISGNHVRANYGAGVRVHSGTKISITGNRITESTGSGISCLSQSDTYTTEITVNGNTFIDNSAYAIDTPTTNLSACTVSVDGNTIISSNIATLQATGFVINGAASVWNIGSNTFSSNYNTDVVETSFASRATKAFLQINSATLTRMKPVLGVNYTGSATYDPASIAAGAGVTTTVTVTGAALGDFTQATFSLDLQGVTLSAWVSAANTVSVRFQNGTGAPIDLASGTIRARVTKP